MYWASKQKQHSENQTQEEIENFPISQGISYGLLSSSVLKTLFVIHSAYIDFVSKKKHPKDLYLKVIRPKFSQISGIRFSNIKLFTR